jgi:Tfp pilus assembly protein PilF
MRISACLMFGLLIAPTLAHCEEQSCKNERKCAGLSDRINYLMPPVPSERDLFVRPEITRLKDLTVLAGEADEPSASGRSRLVLSQHLVVPPVLDLEPPERTELFWLVLAGGDDDPHGTDVLVKGLPVGATLSAGSANADRGWRVPLSALEDLKIRLPPDFSGQFDLDVALIDSNGVVLDEHTAELRVKPASSPAAVAQAAPPAAVAAPTAQADPAAAVAAPAAEADPAAAVAQAAPPAASTGPVAHADPPRQETATTDKARPAMAKPQLIVAPDVNVEAATAAKLSISVSGRADDIPAGASVHVKGLPMDVTLSGGQPIDDGTWIVPLWALADLRITPSPGTPEHIELIVALVDSGGVVLDERPAAVYVKPAAVAVPSRPRADDAPPQDAAVTTAPPPQLPPPPELVVASVLDAEAAAATPLTIKVGGEAGSIPAGTQVRVAGLAGGATLSGGQADADRGWLIPPGALEDLKIQVPSDMTGTFDLGVALVDHEGAVLAERHVAVRIKPRIAAVPGNAPARQQTDAATPAPAEALRLVERQQAIADLDRAIRLNPNDAEAYNIRGNVWDDLGDADRALADYEQAIRIDPNNPGPLRDRGILWRRKGALNRALVDLDRAIRLSFSNAQIYSDRGLLWYEKGHHDRALADFRRAVKIDPDFAIAYINRGVVAHRRRAIDRASPELDQAIHVDPSVFDAIRPEKSRP